MKILSNKYYFDFINPSDLEKAEDLVITQGDAKAIFDFAFQHKTFNYEKFEKAIVETKDIKYLAVLLQLIMTES